MRTIANPQQFRCEVDALRKNGKRIGVVPTMGALHEGHLSLMRLARGKCDCTVATIFVNPTQFNNPDDYRAYTINLDRDSELLRREGVDLLFAPSVDQMYPQGFQTGVDVGDLTKRLEGEFRPGHFRSVATVVSILFHITQPDVAVFGEKDFQQVRVVEQMVSDLHLGIEIVRAPIIRENDGLAMSSRNGRLSSEARSNALTLIRGLRKAVDVFSDGERRAATLETIARREIQSVADNRVDYVTVADSNTLLPVDEIRGPCRLLVAAHVGGVRLIDNVGIG